MPICDRARRGARLAHRAHRPSGRARCGRWLAVAPLAVPAFVHSYAWVGPFPRSRPAGGGARLGARLFPVPLPAGRGAAAPPRPGARGRRRLARPQPPRAGVPARGAAAAAARHLRRRAAGRAAPAGRIRAFRDVRFDTLHHRDRRPVPVDLQRPGGQHAAGVLVPAAWCCSALERWFAAASALRPRRPGAARPPRAAPARPAWRCRRSAAAGAAALLALGVPLVDPRPLAGRSAARGRGISDEFGGLCQTAALALSAAR